MNAQAGDRLAVGALPTGITAIVDANGQGVTLSGLASRADYEAAIEADHVLHHERQHDDAQYRGEPVRRRRRRRRLGRADHHQLARRRSRRVENGDVTEDASSSNLILNSGFEIIAPRLSANALFVWQGWTIVRLCEPPGRAQRFAGSLLTREPLPRQTISTTVAGQLYLLDFFFDGSARS